MRLSRQLSDNIAPQSLVVKKTYCRMLSSGLPFGPDKISYVNIVIYAVTDDFYLYCTLNRPCPLLSYIQGTHCRGWIWLLAFFFQFHYVIFLYCPSEVKELF